MALRESRIKELIYEKWGDEQKMWRYLIELFTDKCYGDFVEAAEVPSEGLPVCSDPVVAIDFASPDELIQWVKDNTSLDYEKEEYGIKGIYYKDYREKGKH